MPSLVTNLPRASSVIRLTSSGNEPPFVSHNATTANGSLWAFTLPRNSRQFFVYLLDRNRRHGEILKAAYVGYGETILAADLIVDIVGADGIALGRVLALPYPDHLSADGPGILVLNLRAAFFELLHYA